MTDLYDDYSVVACCAWNSVQEILEEDPILQPASTGSPSHAGSSFCCDSLFVWWGSAVTDENFDPRENCSTSVDESLIIQLAIPACSEKSLFSDRGQCSEDLNGCTLSDDDGCPEVNHHIPTDGCEGETVNVVDESAYVWRARSVLRRQLGKRIMCCADECDCPVRCRQVHLVLVEQETEGGCAYLTFTYRIKW